MARPIPHYCGQAYGPKTCLRWVGTLNLRTSITYHPFSHFWPLQSIESGIFVALAAVLAAFCFRYIRRVS